MATHRAIAAACRAVLRLLEDACPRAEFPNAQFDLYQTSDFQKPPMAEGVSLYLYRVGINTTLRSRPPRTEADGRRYRPSLPVDLFFALCAWARTADVQHRLMGWCMRTLEDSPVLPAGLLNLPGPERTTFRAQETVEVICDPASLQDLGTLWEVLKPNVPLIVTYAARMIAIESDVPLADLGVVQTREFVAVKERV